MTGAQALLRARRFAKRFDLIVWLVSRADYNYDGKEIHVVVDNHRRPTLGDARSIVHEVAHYIVATKTERTVVNYGCGPGPNDQSRLSDTLTSKALSVLGPRPGSPITVPNEDDRELEACVVDTLICAELELATIRARTVQVGIDLNTYLPLKGDQDRLNRDSAIRRLVHRRIVSFDRDFRLVLTAHVLRGDLS